MILSSLDKIHENSNYFQKDRIKALVFFEIASKENITRKKIINNLELRPTSVSNAINELFNDELIVEIKKELSEQRQGRPETSISPQKNKYIAAAIYFQSRTLIAELINPFEEVLSKTSVIIEEDDDNKIFKKKFTSIIENIMSNVPKNSLFIGIGISLIGFIDFKSDSWVFTARWPLIRNLKFSELSALSHKPLTIKRALDCEMETLISSTKSLQDKDVLLIHWGYGIGAAFAEKGKVVKTNIGGFCEFGHWQGFTNNKSLCSCGSIGCLEASAALWSLIPRLKKDFPDAPEDEDIFYDYLRKHKTIVHHPEIQDAILNMAKSIAQLYTIFFPQRILIYGPMSDNNYIFESLKTNIVELIPFFSRKYFSFEQLRTNNKGQVLASVSELFLDMYKKTLNAR